MATSDRKLIIRAAEPGDVSNVHRLVRKAYPNIPPYSIDQLRAHIRHFPEGVMVAEFDGRIVGYSASMRAKGERALAQHTWREITGGGYGSTHDPDGDYLYGYEVCVDPEFRGIHIGQRLYAARRRLCIDLHLRGIVFGGRMPGYKRRSQDVTPEEYLEKVQDKVFRDPVITFQLRNGFEPIGVLKAYAPSDQDSLTHAVHMVWKNPAMEAVTRVASAPGRRPTSVRVAVVQYLQRRIDSFEEFANIAAHFVSAVAEKKSDFVLFPELFSIQLLSVEGSHNPLEAVRKLAGYSGQIRALFQDLAIKNNVNIIGGSHPTQMPDGSLQNICYVCLRDGSVYEQAKIHPTPEERHWWKMTGGSSVSAIATDCGPIGVLICYDSEFPELARHLVADQGANILFVPFSTEERQGYLRVRYCGQARAVENQCFVALAGNVGNLPRVPNVDIHYAQSCILTPCDFQFSRDGVAADTTPNVEMIAFADLDLDDLLHARNSGTVLNIRDRRHDLYSVNWHGPA